MATASADLRSGEYAYESDDTWAKLPDGWAFHEVGGVAVDESDNVYVFNRGDHPVIVFDKNGNFVRSFGEETFTARAHGIHISPDGFVYLIDDSQHCIHKFTKEGQLVWVLAGKAGEGKAATKWGGESFNRPTHICVSPKSGELYITDGYGNARVHRYTPDGKEITSWGAPGCEPGEFQNPHNVVVDMDENVYVADRENNRVQVFDNTGKVQAVWHDIYRPDGMCMDKNGIFYVGELDGLLDAQVLGHRISILSKDGKKLARIGGPDRADGPGQFIAPHGCATDSQGNLYVGEVSFTRKGNFEDPKQTYNSFRRLVRVKA